MTHESINQFGKGTGRIILCAFTYRGYTLRTLDILVWGRWECGFSL